MAIQRTLHMQMTPQFALAVLDAHPEWASEMVTKDCGHGATVEEARGYFSGLIDAGMRVIPCSCPTHAADGSCLGGKTS